MVTIGDQRAAIKPLSVPTVPNLCQSRWADKTDTERQKAETNGYRLDVKKVGAWGKPEAVTY
jgi:hypothetical protein